MKNSKMWLRATGCAESGHLIILMLDLASTYQLRPVMHMDTPSNRSRTCAYHLEAQRDLFSPDQLRGRRVAQVDASG